MIMYAYLSSVYLRIDGWTYARILGKKIEAVK